MKQLFCKSKLSATNKYEIFNDFDNINKVGQLKDDSWITQSTGELNSNKFVFKSPGLFSNKTDIFKVDLNNYKEEKVGEIEFNTWRSKAQINIYNQNFNYEYTNIWNTKFKIANINEIIVITGENKSLSSNINIEDKSNEYQNLGDFDNKQISYYEIADVLSLSSLYINNYFTYIILFIIFMTVIISSSFSY